MVCDLSQQSILLLHFAADSDSTKLVSKDEDSGRSQKNVNS
jgi:hypothetical protein